MACDTIGRREVHRGCVSLKGEEKYRRVCDTMGRRETHGADLKN